ncbi:hypothetical protein [Gracilimonas mengyeensis]|uniref:Uncharacterized protein n=1 Tax=Gracilimonas mengyeensis TaxID=1302730 RepID=A0A521F5G2_9BACT|nr:hypothetical protein [Gracilimonas mengyeensis]SMO91387.1 hypothetical protein SAMN06265219_11577 [Gracilimonas mengyeensis]
MYKEKKYTSIVGETVNKQLESTDCLPKDISAWTNKMDTVNRLHLTSAGMGVLLGLCVVALSLTNLIEPLWFASFMTVFGSMATVTGFYFLYELFTYSGTFDSLVHKAIKRAVTDRN